MLSAALVSLKLLRIAVYSVAPVCELLDGLNDGPYCRGSRVPMSRGLEDRYSTAAPPSLGRMDASACGWPVKYSAHAWSMRPGVKRGAMSS